MGIDWLSDYVVAVSAAIGRTMPENAAFTADGGADEHVRAAIESELREKPLPAPVLASLRASLVDQSFLLFEDVFDCTDLPSTPTGFSPVPTCRTTDLGRIATLIVHRALGMETVSYGSENDGLLFVNLVAMQETVPFR